MLTTNNFHSSANTYNPHNKKSYESFISEFRSSREDVINILRIIIEQRQVGEFTTYILERKDENQKQMKEFISSKYFFFVKSIDNVNDCRSLIEITEEVVGQLESKIQNFLADFSAKYLDKIRKKEKLETLKEERQKMQNAYIFFAYLNKAKVCLKDGQFDMTIRLINTAYEKYLRQFPLNSAVYKRGEQQLTLIKNKITSVIEEKLTNWLVTISKEQNSIGETFYNKLKGEEERDRNLVRKSKNEFNLSEDKKKELGGKRNIRSTKNIVDNLLLIRNTSNLNYMMNKNSVLKSSVLNQADMIEEFDILNMVSNVDLNFLEQSYSIYKKVDIDTKFIEHFINFRQSQLHSIIKLRHDDKSLQFYNINYENYFAEILGYLIIQVSVFEILPVFYTKRKFEDMINYFLRELNNNLQFEFNNLSIFDQYINLQQNIFLFTKAIDRIGIAERVGVDIRSTLLELMKEKAEDLNFILINKYNNIFVNLLCEEKCLNIEVKSQEEYMKYVSQYLISLEENSMNYSKMDYKTSVIYPFKLPYTIFVVEVNEHFKRYVDEIFEFIQPLYNEYDNVIIKFVGHFLQKFNEVFHTFSNFQEQDLNIILAAHICNNIKYIAKSRDFFTEFVLKKCHYNIDTRSSQGYTHSHAGQMLAQSLFIIEESLRKTWENYEEIIYENLKNKIREMMLELPEENWMPDRKSDRPHMYVEGMLSYLSIIYESLQNISPFYIQTCFKDSIDHISKIYIQDIFLVDSKNIKNYNFYFIENIRIDIETIDEFLNKINHIWFVNCLNHIKMVLMIFYSKKFDHLYDKGKNTDKSILNLIKIPNLIEFLHKYKNLKKAEMKGKISESDLSSVIKKLKEFIKENNK